MIGIANPSNPLCDRFNHYNVLMFCNSAGWSCIVQQDEWHWKVSGGEVEGVEFQHRKLWRVRDAQRCTWQHVLLKIHWIGSFTLLDNLLFKAPQYSDIKTIQDKQSYIISTLNSLSDMHILCTSARLLKLDFQHARRKCPLWVINIKMSNCKYVILHSEARTFQCRNKQTSLDVEVDTLSHLWWFPVFPWISTTPQQWLWNVGCVCRWKMMV